MARQSERSILRQIHSLLTVGTFSGCSDQQLLERFVARRDAVSELAFAVLVERHGPMVLGVCRRILVDPHDAEDAFQATFLVLVRKAGSIRVEGSVGRWLFGVATRVAAQAKANARRRRGRERSGLDRIEAVAPPAPAAALELAELRSALSEELARLPSWLQAPVVLCDFEGSSYEDAARRLGWPLGTVKSRLSRARARLRARLLRRGLAPADFSSTLPFVPAALPRGLVETTIQAARTVIAGRLVTPGIIPASVAALTEGVLRTMFFSKLKLAAAALVLIAAGSTVLVSRHAAAQKPPGRTGGALDVAASASAEPQATPRDDEVDVIMLERAWAEAIPRRDVAVVSRILAGDFAGIDSLGKIATKENYLYDLRKGVFPKDMIEDTMEARLFGDSAVVTSRNRINSSASWGRTMNVYLRRQGRWQCVASQASWNAEPPKKYGTSEPKAGDEKIRDDANAPAGRRSNKDGSANDPRNETPVDPRLKENYDPRAPQASQSQQQGERNAPNAPNSNQDQNPTRQNKAGSPTGPTEQMTSSSANKNQDRNDQPTQNNPQPSKGGTGSKDPTVRQEMRDQVGWADRLGTHPYLTQRDRVTLRPIRARFECLVERVHVAVGETVKKGDALLELFSADLAAAKNDYLTKEVVWKQNQRQLEMRRKLHAQHAISEQVFVDTQNEEEKSKLALQIALDNLRILGLNDNAIAAIGKEDGAQKARLTLHSPSDGRVRAVHAELGELYDKRIVLMVIGTNQPVAPAGQSLR